MSKNVVVSRCICSAAPGGLSVLVMSPDPGSSIGAMAAWLGVDSLAYLQPEGLMTAVQTANPKGHGYCTACFTGNYEAGKPSRFEKLQHEDAEQEPLGVR